MVFEIGCVANPLTQFPHILSTANDRIRFDDSSIYWPDIDLLAYTCRLTFADWSDRSRTTRQLMTLN